MLHARELDAAHAAGLISEDEHQRRRIVSGRPTRRPVSRNVQPELMGQRCSHSPAHRPGRDVLDGAADLERRDAPRSIVRSWWTRIRPSLVWPACPSGWAPRRDTSVARVVIGQTVASPDRWNGSYDTTSARRRPCCSCPTVGSRSTMTMAQRNGAAVTPASDPVRRMRPRSRAASMVNSGSSAASAQRLASASSRTARSSSSTARSTTASCDEP